MAAWGSGVQKKKGYMDREKILLCAVCFFFFAGTAFCECVILVWVFPFCSYKSL